MLDVDTDHGARHDRGLVVVGPVAAAAESGMQTTPGGHVHGAVAVIGGDRFVVWVRPGLGFGAAAALAVTAGPPGGAGLGVSGMGVEDAVIADPDHHAGRGVGQFVGQRDRVVAGVEDKRRSLVVGWAGFGSDGWLRPGSGWPWPTRRRCRVGSVWRPSVRSRSRVPSPGR